MIKKNIEELTTYMKIGKDVHSSDGTLLVQRGTVVNCEILYLLQTHDIKAVEVLSPEDITSHTTVSPQQVQEIEQRIEDKFQEFDQDEQMKYLACLAKDYLKLKATKKDRESRRDP